MAVEWNSAAATLAVRKAAMTGVVSGTEAVRALAVRKIMEPPKSGNVYKRGGVSHQASAPGESPANDLGNLVRSARTEYDVDNLRGYVVFSTPYAAALEYGALRSAMGSYWELQPRPYARPALFELAPDIRADIARNIAAVLGTMGRKK